MARIESQLHTLNRRLAQLERQRLKRLYLPIALEFHMDVDELLDECEAFLAMPLDAQLREVDRLFAEDPDADIAEREDIKRCLTDPTAKHAAKIHVYRPAPGPPSVTKVLQLAWEAQPLPPTSDRTPRRDHAPESVTVAWPSAPEPEPAPEPVPAPVDDDDDDAEVDDELADLLAQVQRRLAR